MGTASKTMKYVENDGGVVTTQFLICRSGSWYAMAKLELFVVVQFLSSVASYRWSVSVVISIGLESGGSRRVSGSFYCGSETLILTFA